MQAAPCASSHLLLAKAYVLRVSHQADSERAASPQDCRPRIGCWFCQPGQRARLHASVICESSRQIASTADTVCSSACRTSNA